MIVGFVNRGEGRKAFALFWRMQDEEVEPTTAKCYAKVAAFEEGKRVHSPIIQCGFEDNQ